MAPAPTVAPTPAPLIIDLDDLDLLLASVREQGYELVGPSPTDGVIDYAPVSSVRDLPLGWVDDQAPGRYRAAPSDDAAASWVFGYATAAQSPKRYLFPPREEIVRAIRAPSGEIRFDEPVGAERPLALIGVRSCELHAIAIQDRVLLEGAYPDSAYRDRRAGALVIAVDCSHPGGTCFCVSMGTGPSVDADAFGGSVADIVLSELPPAEAAARRRFVVRGLSARGRDLIEPFGFRPASDEHLGEARAVSEQARGRMGRTIDVSGLRELLVASPDHPAWEETAGACLSCTNCTLVCPTCFCTTTEEHSNLVGDEATRSREWDSCFSLSFSYLHGGSVRTSTTSRYRHWATHKLSTWFEQFDTPGCVGCGRCITWCPAGIDLTAHVRAMQRDDPTGQATLLGEALADGMTS